MTFQHQWLKEPTIYEMIFSENITFQEIGDVFTTYNQQIDAVPDIPKVHLIVDLNAVEQFPRNMLQMHNIAKTKRHDRAGCTCVVGAGKRLQQMTTLMKFLLQLNVELFDDREAALSYIAELDNNLGED